jgi:serine/threonine-protein kinase
MNYDQRYEIISTIATGDFATVYRARDRELSRDIAIKQIHQQFLVDPRQLDRYWQEAQLLASLQHQYIMTIYDVVRDRGWLVLELMRNSLAGELMGQPIGIDQLRIALVQCLHALDFLHSRGIVHGDVKPTNMMIGLNKRLKIGDFGLARRAGNAEGSLLKGTAKYMAPEVMSEQFGPVGPASDIYSLGFSAYELLCGSHFESLFPGLNSFGRDKAVAWMMWHAAPDRRLPEIGKVLEGVPENLAAVIHKMIAKDQSQRYKTAVEVLEALDESSLQSMVVAQTQAPPSGPTPEDSAHRKRLLAIAAFGVSLVLTVVMLLFPNFGSQSSAPPPNPTEVREGHLSEVFVKDRKVIMLADGDRKPIEVDVPGDIPIKLYKKKYEEEDLTFVQLKPEDRVKIELERGPKREWVAKSILVTRKPAAQKPETTQQ